jgi:hypothetical protein
MPSTSALVIPDSAWPSTRFGGVALEEHARRAARQAGVTRVTTATCPERPFATAVPAALAIVLSASTVVEPAAIERLIADAPPGVGEAVVVVDAHPAARHRFLRLAAGRVTAVLADGNASSLNLLVLSRAALEQVRGARSLTDALQRLARAGVLRAVGPGRPFCQRLHEAGDLRRVERAYRAEMESGLRGWIRTWRWTALSGFTTPRSCKC